MTARRVPPHAFDPDPDVPRDYRGRRYCRTCHLPGKAGDDRHPHDALPATPPDARELEHRLLGERGTP